MANRVILARVRIVIAFAVLSCFAIVCSARSDGGPTDWNAATVTMVTSFSGADLRQLANGQAIDMARLPETRKDQLLWSIDSAIGYNYNEWQASLPDSAKVVVWIAPEFFLTFKGDDFGVNKTLTLSLSRLVAGLKPAAVYKEDATGLTNPLPDPPALSDLMAQAPPDQEARSGWLREEAFELLAPIGTEWLARAGIPLSYCLFAQPKDVPIRTLAAEETTWLKAFYSKYAADTKAKQELLRRQYEKEKRSPQLDDKPFVAVDVMTGVTANSAEVPSYALPLWDELASRTVISTSVRYLPTIEAVAARNVCVKGLGWYLK